VVGGAIVAILPPKVTQLPCRKNAKSRNLAAAGKSRKIMGASIAPFDGVDKSVIWR